MNIIKKLSFIAAAASILTLTGCSAVSQSSGAATTVQTAVAGTNLLDTSSMFTDRDTSASYDESSATKITLNNETVTISEEGTYILSGEISDGQVIIDAADTSKIQIVLNGVTINSSNSAAIYVKSADKVFITSVQGTENTLSMSGEYSDENVDGVVFSKSDLTFNGNGELTINSASGHGIVGKDDVVVAGGTYNITSEKKGVSANDSLRVSSGNFNINSGTDAIDVENTEDTSKGYIYIKDGNFEITTAQDGLSSSGVVQIDGGTFNINAVTATSSTEDISVKGIKSDSDMLINNGTFNIESDDDAFNGNSNIQIKGGTFNLKTSGDGIHADGNLVVDGGEITIPTADEGLEGLTITINDGTFDVTTTDDGMNASDGSKNDDPMAVTENASITINGGNIKIVSDGDSLDSNGSLTINGGTLDLTCNGNGNTAIDAGGTYIKNGGNVKTNDGSEENGGQMGGGQGGPGQMGGAPGSQTPPAQQGK